MKINTIILIEENQEKKKKFLDKLKKEIDFSYTKLEAIFESCSEIFPEEYNKNKKENFYKFLEGFLNNLNKKQGFFIIDIDRLSVTNVNKLIENKNNILAIYFKEIEDCSNVISIDINNLNIIDELIMKIKK